MSELSINRENKMREIDDLRDALDIAKANKDAVEFKKLAIKHASATAEYRKLTRQQNGAPWRFKNQARQLQAVLFETQQDVESVDNALGLDFDTFKTSYLIANPESTVSNIRFQWKKFKKINNLPQNLSSCAKLPQSLCDENPNCQYTIGMKRQGCRKIKKKYRRKSIRRKSRRARS